VKNGSAAWWIGLGSRIEIDEIDVYILETLLKDSRTSFSKIAEAQQVSPNTIRARFNRMKKEGIITGSSLELNPRFLGYEGIGFLAINTTYSEENNVLEYLKSIPNIIQTHIHIGTPNIVSILAIKNLEELAKTMETVRNRLNINSADAAISTDSMNINYPGNLIISQYYEDKKPRNKFSDTKKDKKTNNIQNIHLPQTKENNFNESFELDKIDYELIRSLSENSRESFRKISKKLGISTKSVIKRYNRLKKNVITNSSIKINLRKLGYICNAIFCIKVEKQTNISEITSKILKIPNMILLSNCIGGIQILAAAPFSDFLQLFQLKERFSQISEIKEIEILLEKTYSDWPLNIFSEFLKKTPTISA
jgi:Lrp/AsnC family transcriptional regulator for asnA, asnC and gidA